MMHEHPINQAINAAGGVARLASLVGVTPANVSQWRTGHRRVPAERCIVIESVTKGAVTCEMLRPDIDWAVVRRCPDQQTEISTHE